MKTITKKLYEAMFLVDPAQAASDWDGVETLIRNIFKRAETEVVSIKKWGDRNLAYEIDGKSKGVYVLCYFKGDGKKNRDIERDVQLSEQVMRVLILCAEGRDERDIEKGVSAVPAEEDKREVAQVVAEGAEVEEVGGTEAEASAGGAEPQEGEEPTDGEGPADGSKESEQS
ncbi:MAG: 30S ribosomal protein S6 [Planctomycetota bacterium]